MTKTQIFKNKRLPTPGLKYLDEYLTRTTGIFAGPHSTIFEANLFDESHWLFDTFDQFMDHYPTSVEATYLRSSQDHEVEVTNIVDPHHRGTMIVVRAPNRETIQKIFGIIQGCLYTPVVQRPPETDQHNKPGPHFNQQAQQNHEPQNQPQDRKRPCRTNEMSRPR